mgnify:CR=1 FL=1
MPIISFYCTDATEEKEEICTYGQPIQITTEAKAKSKYPN